MIIWRQLETLIHLSKTNKHLLQLHSLIIKTALDHDHLFVSRYTLTSSLISLQTTKFFLNNLPINPPLFACNTLIKQYSKSSYPIESLTLFQRVQRLGLFGNKFMYPLVVKACGLCCALGLGGSVHSLIWKCGFVSDKYVGNSLVTMYGGCNETKLARRVFDEMRDRDVVSWSSMISAYVNCSYPLKAFKIFQQMKLANECPNFVTLVSLLSACTSLLNISIGESIHSYIIINNIELNTPLGTSLLELYSKCGNLDKAFCVFNSMREKNLKSWTIMISGFADHGCGNEAVSLFKQMEKIGIKPDSISFSSILSACSHLGLVEEGKKYFEDMVRVYDIKPTIQHYGCVIDMLGRAGLIKEAYQVIQTMSIEPNTIILRSFIGACKKYDFIVPLDERLRKRLLQIEPDLGANYVVAASVSSLSKNWDEAASIRVEMNSRGLKKVPGWSWVRKNVDLATEFRVEIRKDLVSDNKRH